MQKGEFFERFFSERGSFDEKDNGEYNVLCPFKHVNGYEDNSSAHVNVGKALFHCKTCFAEGKLQTGGLSEIGFMAKVYEISYEEAIEMFVTLDSSEDISESNWHKAKELLYATPVYMNYLQSKRGLTVDTIKKYDLAYSGDGIKYPVVIYKQLCDVRTYLPDSTPKIRSRSGASPLLFPFDHWRKDSRPTLLVAGENDCLLTRQYGFNALTVTAGEGAFPKIFLKMFSGLKVYICYDCDLPGRNAARRVAFLLREAGADVYILDLQLEGSKADKDLTDYFLKHHKTAADLQQLIDVAPTFTDTDMQEEKNKAYPLVDLWDVPEGEFHGRRISSRVILSGKYDTVMQAPTSVQWQCDRPVEYNKTCQSCRLNSKEGWWTLGENLSQLMELVDVKKAQQEKAIDRFIGFPDDCPTGSWSIRSRQAVYKVIFTPDVETEDIMSGFRSTEQFAYTVGLNLEDGNRYRAFFKPFPHPLDGQRVYMIVDRVEDSDNALNSFKMTPEIKKQLEVFQGDPNEMMVDHQKRMHRLTGFLPKELIANAVMLMYCAPLQFEMFGRLRKGYPEIMVVGEPRTGKTETALMFQRYVQVGNFMPVKGATTAGLVGGADKLANGAFKISWGTIPRNHRGLVIMDEFSGMHSDVFSSLTSLRSEMIATVHKIVKGQAPAQTRLYWTSNTKEVNGIQKKMREYNNGIDLLIDLISHEEDIARFDICLAIVRDGTESAPDDVPEIEPHPAEYYRNLIHWAWSRRASNIVFEHGVDKFIRQVADELNDKYDCEGAIVLGLEAWKKLSKVAVACAGATFSCDETGENLVVKKEHVDWAAQFFVKAYDNPVFKLGEYVKKERSLSQVNQAVLDAVEGVCRSNAIVVKQLLDMGEMSRQQLEMVSGLNRNEFGELINRMVKTHLVELTKVGVKPTKRLRVAIQMYREKFHKSEMRTLAEEGVDFF